MLKERGAALRVLILLLLTPAPIHASDGNIGMFFDSDAAICQQVVPCGETAVIYVYALLEGASDLGISGVEYKVQIGPDRLSDPGWLFTESFNPDAVTLGSGAFTPVDASTTSRGIHAVWPNCQMGDGAKILLETVTVLNASNCNMDAELALEVVMSDTPSDDYMRCPIFELCDAPTYTKVCLGSNVVECRSPGPLGINAHCSTSGEAFLNGSRNCSVAIQQARWSTVKELYRR